MKNMVMKRKCINIAANFILNINQQVTGKILDNFEFWVFVQIAILWARSKTSTKVNILLD